LRLQVSRYREDDGQRDAGGTQARDPERAAGKEAGRGFYFLAGGFCGRPGIPETGG
jgi:hypothetical protein